MSTGDYNDHPAAIRLTDGDTLTGESVEVARIWVTNDAGSSVWIDPNPIGEPRVFGYLLADTLRHAARAYAELDELDENDVLNAIYAGLVDELGEHLNTITTIAPSKKVN